MTIDKSGMLGSAIDARLKAARAAEAEGDNKAAAAAYRQVAYLYKENARAALTSAIRRQRLERAALYESRAKGLAASAGQSTGSGPPPDRARGASTEASVGKEELIEEAQQFVFQSLISWEDVGGLEDTKQEIKRNYALAMARKPDGVRLDQFKAMLLYGPPGTGKTQLAAATSNGLDATFFNVKLSAVLSKYFGESSKMMEAVFAAARQRSPSVLFFDEIDSLAVERTGGESGAERRVLSTFLTETEGLETKGESGFVFLIAATNKPWLLDQAVLSRFQRRVLVPLPDAGSREAILGIHLGRRGISLDCSIQDLAALTAGYSGREIEALCSKVVDRIIAEQNPQLAELVERGRQVIAGYTLKFRPVTRPDFEQATWAIRPETSPTDIKRFTAWEQGLN